MAGWKKAAKVNCIVLVSMSVALVGCLIAAVSQAGGIRKALFFYSGDCNGDTVSLVNMALHLLINVVSTLVVLNSPSREEINTAHSKRSWLEIGVPSVRNAVHVSKFKTCSWVILFLSSIPIHLLFNSTIFQTDYREPDFHLTIATEDFLNGAAFYTPGASLVQPGYLLSFCGDGLKYYGDGFPENVYLNHSLPSELAESTNRDSDRTKNITAAANNARLWNKLDIRQCKEEYLHCSGLKYHRNLVVIVDKPGGWIRDGAYEPGPYREMWHFTDNQTSMWNQYVSPDKPNHLFFANQCSMRALLDPKVSTLCINNCLDALTPSRALSLPVNNPAWLEFVNDGLNWQYPFLDSSLLDSVNATDFSQRFYTTFGEYYSSAFRPDALDLSVKYCLAEPLDSICHVALSPALLLGVTICTIVKTCTAIVMTIALVRRKETPLVTLGDAIASFVEHPDPSTIGLCTFGQNDVRKLLKGRPSPFTSSYPTPWKPLQERRDRRRSATVPVALWLTSYFLFAVGITICAVFFVLAYRRIGLWGNFLESDQNSFAEDPFTFIEGALTANSPQLLLSSCYLAYNNLFTHLQMAREWASFSEKAQPLRVTDPQGEQYSTYRLQLPYKYSLPLITLSIFFHWLLSNVIYIFVATGGYYGAGFTTAAPDPSLPPDAVVSIGFSTYALLVTLIVSCLMIVVPGLLSLKRLSQNITTIGRNSFALAAACHTSKLSHAAKTPGGSTATDVVELPRPFSFPSTSLNSEETTLGLAYDNINNAPRLSGVMMQHPATAQQWPSRRSSASEQLIDGQVLGKDDIGKHGRFWKLARSKICWGIVEMPPEWYGEYEREGLLVEHLSFGAEEDNVQRPVPGRLYA
ncbi:hypothetical protein GGR52DRAFT_580403 [Hypoxylon sp. FL1284]|nr:hypothetical protein GGR52DRAFT_580403 [Hypoxylon sp. FL1284]